MVSSAVQAWEGGSPSGVNAGFSQVEEYLWRAEARPTVWRSPNSVVAGFLIPLSALRAPSPANGEGSFTRDSGLDSC